MRLSEMQQPRTSVPFQAPIFFKFVLNCKMFYIICCLLSSEEILIQVKTGYHYSQQAYNNANVVMQCQESDETFIQVIIQYCPLEIYLRNSIQRLAVILHCVTYCVNECTKYCIEYALSLIVCTKTLRRSVALLRLSVVVCPFAI